ncbi:MAG: 2-polyprenylphenol 6-hydroxylase [Hyphomicrobiales bacterium]|nr:2-polyprenylphenol 6-hydroxylase [Hyphomicrobiales bacterium]
MNYLSHLYRLLKLYSLFTDCELPENFLPQNKTSLIAKLLRIKKHKNKTFSDVLIQLGPSYIKLGQFLATRPDIIGGKFALELSNLQDNLPTFANEISQKIVEEDFNTDIKNVFTEFNEPIAAASIAQVHTGKIDDNQKVAIKILRPKIEEKFRDDFKFFYFVSGLLEKLNPNLMRLKFTESIQTMERSVKMEMDLRFEAAAISEINNNMTDEDEYIIPKIFWEKTTRKILTIEWIDGISIRDKDSLKKRGFDLKNLARIIIQSFLTQALRNGFFHADMHQGNLLINEQGKLVILDFGIMGRLGEKEQTFLAEILWGLITKNYKRTAEVHFEAGYIPKDQKLDEFSQALRAIGEPLSGKKANDISMANVLSQLFEVTEQFHMETRPELLLLQKTMVVTEGVARELDPDLNMWDIAKPIVSKWMEEKISPEVKIKKNFENLLNLGSAITEFPYLIDQAKKTTENFNRLIEYNQSKNKINENTFWRFKFWIITFIGLLIGIYVFLV